MFIAASVLTIGLTSCGNSMEKDAKSVTDLMCQSFELQLKAMDGEENAAEEAKKIEETSAALVEKIEKKYTSEEDKKAFGELMEKNMEDCDAYKKMMESLFN